MSVNWKRLNIGLPDIPYFTVDPVFGTHEDERTVLYETISLDGIKPNTNPKINPESNPNPNTNPNPKLTLILTLFSCFMLGKTMYLHSYRYRCIM